LSAEGAQAAPRPPAGLCDSCRHQKLIRTGRGSEFSMCLLSRSDPRFAKYPRVPVLRCSGYSGRSSTR
jgi:hypothetical protein